MTKKLLYLFGEPGSGKITVAREVQRRLGWRLFWLHDLDAVCAIVGRYPIPRLMDRVSLAVLEEMMDAGEDIIYVRPSRDPETVEGVVEMALDKGYSPYPVRLTVSRQEAIRRITNREKSEFRVSTEVDLDKYLDGRPWPTYTVRYAAVDTNSRTVQETVDKVMEVLNGDCHCAIGVQAGAVPAGRA